jgi:hypothetical protein
MCVMWVCAKGAGSAGCACGVRVCACVVVCVLCVDVRCVSVCACVGVCRRVMCDVRGSARVYMYGCVLVRVSLRVFLLKCVGACACIRDRVCDHVHIGCLFL